MINSANPDLFLNTLRCKCNCEKKDSSLCFCQQKYQPKQPNNASVVVSDRSQPLLFMLWLASPHVNIHYTQDEPDTEHKCLPGKDGLDFIVNLTGRQCSRRSLFYLNFHLFRINMPPRRKKTYSHHMHSREFQANQKCRFLLNLVFC